MNFIHSYCNSILQCLYYSVPFRESVINYPRRTPIETLEAALAKNLRYQNPEAHLEADASGAKQKAANGTSTARTAGVPPNQPQKPEDKDSPEYKKKMAMQTLPLLETKDNAASYGMSESLFTSLKDIFESVVASQSRTGIIRPQHFLDVLRREYEMFRTAMHQDAHEFLNILLNEVVANVEAEAAKQREADRDSSNTENGDSERGTATTGSGALSNGSKTPNTTRWVHELFEGTLTSETQCLTCEKVSQKDEVFLDLSVDLEQHSSVTSCLRKFSAEEMLCERNKFHCDNCGGLQEAEKRMKIKRLPRILALHLKRFKYTEDLQKLQKLFHRVVYPYHLRLFNTTDDAEDPDRLYELYAVVVHIGGGPYHGHYVAIIKTEDRGWLLFDDEMVEPVDKNYVRNFFGDRPGLACAYVLFYQETTLEAVQREQEQESMAAMESCPELKDLSAKQNGTPVSPGLGDEASRFSPLKHAHTAPALSTQPENTLPASDVPISPVPVSSSAPDSAPLAPKKSDIQSKKERKAAEKEKEKAKKQKRKELEAKLREDYKDYKREHAELQAELDASRASKVEEDRRNATEDEKNKEEPSPKTLTGSLGRFKLSSKSVNQKLARRKAKRTFSEGQAPLPEREQVVSDADIPEKPPRRSMQLVNDLVREEDREVPKIGSTKAKHDVSGHGKWKSFVLRKKSFNIS